MSNKREKVSVRITPNQQLVLQEMCNALDTTYSMLIRTIIGDWITHNEEYIYRIIDKKRDNATHQQIGEEAQEIF